MKFKSPSLYQLKKWLHFPRTCYLRKKEQLEPGLVQTIMERHYYRPAIYHWLKARINDEKILHTFDLDENSVVIDIGAYTGEWASEIADLYKATVYAFEPNPNSFKALQKHAASRPHLKPLPYGLGAEDETVQITLKNLGSSIIDPSQDTILETTETQIKALDRAMATLQLDHVDLMKINIEGAEFPLMEHMINTDWLANVDCYMIQFHEWHPGAYRRRRRIQRALSKTHRLVWDYHFVWEKWVKR